MEAFGNTEVHPTDWKSYYQGEAVLAIHRRPFCNSAYAEVALMVVVGRHLEKTRAN